MSSKRHNAFTLIEILIVIVIMAVLAATIIPQFTDSTQDARESTAEFNLNTLRSQIEMYKAQHGGAAPSTLSDLTTTSDFEGKTYGPYMTAIPENSITKDATVKGAAGATIVEGDVTADGGGWIYSDDTGEVRIDHPDHWQK